MRKALIFFLSFWKQAGNPLKQQGVFLFCRTLKSLGKKCGCEMLHEGHFVLPNKAGKDIQTRKGLARHIATHTSHAAYKSATPPGHTMCTLQASVRVCGTTNMTLNEVLLQS